MEITLKLFSYFAKLLPPEAKHYAIEVETEPGIRVAEVLESFGVPLDECRLIIINGIVHTRPDQALQFELKPGDALAVLPNVH